MSEPLTVLTWNVAGRLSRLDEQVEGVLGHGADVVCLQEVIPNALPRWTERLQAAEYAVAASAVAPDAPRVHRLGVLVASRHPITYAGPAAAAPWPERLLGADTQPAGWPQPLRVMTLHAPLSQREDQVKIRTLEAVHAALASLDDGVAAVLCGDFNTPQYEARDRSWKTGRHPGYRLDHILVSPALPAVACAYDHSLREEGLSDHSAMYATVAPRPTSGSA